MTLWQIGLWGLANSDEKRTIDTKISTHIFVQKILPTLTLLLWDRSTDFWRGDILTKFGEKWERKENKEKDMDKSLCDIFPGTQARPQPNKYVLTTKTFVSLFIIIMLKLSQLQAWLRSIADHIWEGGLCKGC